MISREEARRRLDDPALLDTELEAEALLSIITLLHNRIQNLYDRIEELQRTKRSGVPDSGPD